MLNLIWENEQDKIEITDELFDKIKLSIEKALEYEEFTDDCEISLTFVDNDAIREINSNARGKESATDVLSFPMLETDEDGTLIIYDEDIVDGRVLLGDIVISAQRAQEQAEEFGHSLVREMCFLAVHSVLHLLGYDHERSAEEEKIQFEKQDEILNILGITR
ncbi:MAG: rRNA maturation RNase YbeY [Clostridia bacterium]|nr:rRNA maturation RNase YbeY [Clostridia bacterium]